jgi:hypothetical protein
MTEAHPMNSCRLIHHLAEGGQARVGYQVPMLQAALRLRQNLESTTLQDDVVVERRKAPRVIED